MRFRAGSNPILFPLCSRWPIQRISKDANVQIRDHDPPRSSRMLKNVLIANRGEIACRIIRSLKSLGIG
ncbi:MAG: hypothetical protein IT493_10450, partial [Gammaproteobacteria bacterium]|nr:hypothetical protein [Gammaproteobacteria bacterium]